MKQEQQRQVNALRGANSFLATHATELGTLATTEGGKQLAAAVTALADLDNAQRSADLFITGHVHDERNLSTTLRREHMVPIATFARTRLRGTAGFAALTVVATKFDGLRLVREARAMATAAAPHADAFVAGGFPADTVAQLGAAAMALESAVEERGRIKAGRKGTTKGIAEELRSGREAVKMLHAVIRRQFANNPHFLTEWNAVHRVSAKVGAVRGGSTVVPITPITPVVPVAPVTAFAGVTPVAGVSPLTLASPVAPVVLVAPVVHSAPVTAPVAAAA